MSVSALKLVPVSVGGAIVSLLLAIVIRYRIERLPANILHFETQIFVIPLIYAATFYVFDANAPRNRRDPALLVVTYFCANVVACLVALAFVYLQGLDRLGRGVFGLFATVEAGISIGSRLLLDRVAAHLFPPRRTLIVGPAEEAQKLLRLLRDATNSRLKPVAVLNTSDGKSETELDCPVYVGSTALRELATTERADCVVLVPPYKREGDLFRQIAHCRLDGVEVFDAVEVYEATSGRVPLDSVIDYWALFLSLNKIRPVNVTLKRVIDLVFSSILVILAAPLMAMIALLIKALSPGPVFYCQERLGHKGTRFPMIKFRTMIPDAEALTGPVMATANDSRVTPLGRFLREWRLDELPQLINVLRGEMSLVGPRPEREAFATDFGQRVPVFRRALRRNDAEGTYVYAGWREAIHLYPTRLFVKPGLTGWAQVNYPYASSLAETKEQFEYDLFYLQNQSLLFDMSILLRTVGVLIRPTGH